MKLSSIKRRSFLTSCELSIYSFKTFIRKIREKIQKKILKWTSRKDSKENLEMETVIENKIPPTKEKLIGKGKTVTFKISEKVQNIGIPRQAKVCTFTLCFGTYFGELFRLCVPLDVHMVNVFSKLWNIRRGSFRGRTLITWSKNPRFLPPLVPWWSKY